MSWNIRDLILIKLSCTEIHWLRLGTDEISGSALLKTRLWAHVFHFFDLNWWDSTSSYCLRGSLQAQWTIGLTIDSYRNSFLLIFGFVFFVLFLCLFFINVYTVFLQVFTIKRYYRNCLRFVRKLVLLRCVLAGTVRRCNFNLSLTYEFGEGVLRTSRGVSRFLG